MISMNWFKANARWSPCRLGWVFGFCLLGALLVWADFPLFSLFENDIISATTSKWVAPPKPAQAAKLPTLIATFRNRPPEMQVYSERRFSGPLRYVLEEAASRIGYAIEWRQMELSAAEHELREGKIDVVPFIRYQTPDRQKIMRYSASLGLTRQETRFVLHSADTLDYKSMGELKGLNVGFVNSLVYVQEFQEASDFNKSGYASYRDMAIAFVENKLDTFITSSLLASERALAESGYEKTDYKYATLNYATDVGEWFVYSLNPERQEIYNRLDRALIEIRDSGLAAEIYKHFGVAPHKLNR